MNRRPRLLASAAVGATAALLLTGCGGGGGGSKGNDKIAGADTGETTSASPSVSATDVADRPKVNLPSDVKDKYESWQTGDKAKDEILTDTASRIDATNAAILSGDTGAPGLAFYYRDKALSGAVQWVQAYVDANLSFTGTTRYYSPQVTLSGAKSASVVYCADESKGFNKNRKTNKVDKTPSDESPYVLYNTRLEKNTQGVWQATNLISKRGDKTCAG